MSIYNCDNIVKFILNILLQPHLPPYPGHVQEQHGQQGGDWSRQSAWQVQEEDQDHVLKNPQGMTIIDIE